MKLKLHLICITLCVLVTAPEAHPEEPGMVINGVHFARTSREGATPLTLRGVAVLRYLKLIKAYAGALYLPDGVSADKVLADIPKQLVLEYFQPIKAGDFAAATRAMARENTDAETFARISHELYRLCRSYLPVRPKDRYTLSYHPKKGLSLALNTTVLGTFQGAEVARAMFAIWIGENPIDTAFRNRLLGL